MAARTNQVVPSGAQTSFQCVHKCGFTGPYDVVADHELVCIKNPAARRKYFQCENGCGYTGSYDDVTAHEVRCKFVRRKDTGQGSQHTGRLKFMDQVTARREGCEVAWVLDLMKHKREVKAAAARLCIRQVARARSRVKATREASRKAKELEAARVAGVSVVAAAPVGTGAAVADAAAVQGESGVQGDEGDGTEVVDIEGGEEEDEDEERKDTPRTTTAVSKFTPDQRADSIGERPHSVRAAGLSAMAAAGLMPPPRGHEHRGLAPPGSVPDRR